MMIMGRFVYICGINACKTCEMLKYLLIGYLGFETFCVQSEMACKELLCVCVVGQIACVCSDSDLQNKC
jgi:hypothetical protein